MTYPGIENDPAAVQADPDRAAVEERRRAREQEYSKYVATQDIPWGSVPAYFAGEPVSTDAAEKYGWSELGYVREANATESDATPAPRTAATETAPPISTAATVAEKAKARTGGNE